VNTSTDEQIRNLDRRWADAEVRGDVAALEALTTEDFTLVGPRGFVLNKHQWLDRYRTGALVTRSLSWEDVEVRDYGDAAVAVGCHTQQAAYDGHPADGAFRSTHIAVVSEGQWLLAGVQLSPISGPPSRPPTGAPTGTPEDAR
jgi:ketosteroid isomerase-like protein